MTSMFSSLNQQQTAAVLHQEGPAVILAGAGSGKTKVLTTRASWLISDRKLSPANILLMTFTNKAAQEMNDRVEEITNLRLPFSGTFHRICALILRKNGFHIGLNPNYTIFDTTDQNALIKRIYKDQNLSQKKFSPNAVKAIISQSKNNMITTSKLQASATSEFMQHVVKIYQLYQKELTQQQAVDFDDLLLKTVQLFKHSPQVLKKYQVQFSHILIDEYQDTNKVQYQLTKLLARPQNNAYVVGDFSQSIYAWRGANYNNLNYLIHDFPNITEYRLEQNYRSTQTILDAATQLISQNVTHPILKLWTAKTHQEKITLLETADNQDEAETILAEINKLLFTYQPQDIALLYRVNAQSRAFEEAFVKNGMPYKLVGGFKFYERKEIKDVLTYLKVLANTNDQLSYQRALKLGKKRFDKFNQWKIAQKFSDKINPYQALAQIVDTTEFLAMFNDQDPQDLARIENVKELINVASQFSDLTTFLENIALVQDDHLVDEDRNHSKPAITLISLHSSKGLEFPVVFIVGVEEGLLPHSKSLTDPNQLEEERRLCYVGITRAKEKLFFSYTKQRWQYGSHSLTIKSRFLSEINSNLIKHSNNQNQSPQLKLNIDDALLDSVLAGNVDLDAFLDM